MNPRILAQALQGFDPSPVMRARVQDERLRYADEMRGLNRPMIAHNGVSAAIQGLMNGYLKYKARQGHTANLEDFYSQFEAQEQAKAEAQAQAQMQAAEAERAARMEERRYQLMLDERKRALDGQEKRDLMQFKWQNQPEDTLSPVDRARLVQSEAQTASILQQMQMRDSDNARKDAKEQRAADEASAMKEEKAETDAMLADTIRQMLAPENSGSLEAATGVISSRLPTLRQGTQDFENQFAFVKNALTADKLDLMTGVLSESDIKILQSLAAGGVDLSSSGPQVREALSRFYKGITGEDLSYGQSGIEDLVNKYADPQ